MVLIDIYKTFHQNSKEYTFCSVAQRMVSKADCNSGHKVSINEYKKMEITSYILTDHNG